MDLPALVKTNDRIIKLILAKAGVKGIEDLTGPDKAYANKLTRDNKRAEAWLENSKPK